MATNSPELDALLREFDASLANLEQTLNSINNFNYEDREKKLNKCSVLIKTVRTTKEALQLEAKSLPSAGKSALQDAMKEKLQKFKNLIDAYEFKRSEIDRNVLQTGEPNPRHVMCAETADFTVDGSATKTDLQNIAAQGDALQDQTAAAISNMGYLVTDAQQIADATDAKLDTQTAQMQAIGVNLGTVQSNTKRAGATVANIARTAASDLCIQILCGSIAVCVVTIIVLVSV